MSLDNKLESSERTARNMFYKKLAKESLLLSVGCIAAPVVFSLVLMEMYQETDNLDFMTIFSGLFIGYLTLRSPFDGANYLHSIRENIRNYRKMSPRDYINENTLQANDDFLDYLNPSVEHRTPRPPQNT